MLRIGIIGYGYRMNDLVKEMMATGELKITAIMDRDIELVKTRFINALGWKDITYYSDAKKMMDSEKLDGVCIGTWCNSHTEYAMLVSQYNLPIYLEKPVCTTEEDLARLKSITHINDQIVVSFPLRPSRMITYAKELIDSGKIGEIAHIEAINNVPYATGYFHKWYREERITGGQFLQKATHDLDYINYLLGGMRPVRVCAMKSKQVFKGDKPAGFKCKDCPDIKTCPESPQTPENIIKAASGGIIGEYCCYSEDNTIEDSGSLIVEYDSGLHVTYTQDFVARYGAGRRGAYIIGSKGSIEFDFYSNQIKLYHHYENITEMHSFGSIGGGHFGGDSQLIRNFIGVIKGEESSKTTLKDGILSAEMCLAAKKSSIEHVFVELDTSYMD
ncbi:MAG: Gfo/Idh/MocA family oxidoreductase [Clostridia bacterium]|nr:Gfo/Idh/MocA family oxidoreductase [Clostridia bacterium]